MPAKTVTVTFIDGDGEKFPYAVLVRSGYSRKDYVHEAMGLIEADAQGGDIHPQTPLALWSVEWPEDRVSALADEPSAPYKVERLASGTEDGHLWYVVEHGEQGERRMVSELGWVNYEDAQDEADDFARMDNLTDGQREAVTELRSHCPAAGDFGAAWLQGDKVTEYRYLDPIDRNEHDAEHVAEFVATFLADIAGETDSVIVTVEGNMLTPPLLGTFATMREATEESDRLESLGTIRYVVVPADGGRFSLAVDPSDVVAASLALKAAKCFTVDEDSEDPSSAAQRAADILCDLSPSDVPTFLTRVFGLPADERHSEREYKRLTLHADPSEDWARWRSLGEEARKERGFADVARVLVFEHRDLIVPLAFTGHEATETSGESTNLSTWREALAALEAIAAVRAHTFGGCCLADFASQLDRMDTAAIDALIESVAWAAFNAATWQDGRDSFESGMTRAE